MQDQPEIEILPPIGIFTADRPAITGSDKPVRYRPDRTRRRQQSAVQRLPASGLQERHSESRNGGTYKGRERTKAPARLSRPTRAYRCSMARASNTSSSDVSGKKPDGAAPPRPLPSPLGGSPC